MRWEWTGNFFQGIQRLYEESDEHEELDEGVGEDAVEEDEEEQDEEEDKERDGEDDKHRVLPERRSRRLKSEVWARCLCWAQPIPWPAVIAVLPPP